MLNLVFFSLSILLPMAKIDHDEHTLIQIRIDVIRTAKKFIKKFITIQVLLELTVVAAPVPAQQVGTSVPSLDFVHLLSVRDSRAPDGQTEGALVDEIGQVVQHVQRVVRRAFTVRADDVTRDDVGDSEAQRVDVQPTATIRRT